MNRSIPRKLLIASPRGFCAGVERAIAVVESLLSRDGSPLHVRREIVHNQAVVADFRKRGVVFVDELDQVPDGNTVVFSAHGVSPEVREEAKRRGLQTVDATCPLVTRVHEAVLLHAGAGRQVILIGHPGHDEVLGTMGQAVDSITLVSDLTDVERLDFPAEIEIAYVTQTTLSVDQTSEIVTALKNRFPNLKVPTRSDICFATQNRQDAVKALVKMGIEHLLVVGSANSSNSKRLCEVARNLSVSASLINDSADLPPDCFVPLSRLGLTAGASAPEYLVKAVIIKLQEVGWIAEEVVSLTEKVRFKLPKELRE